MHSVRTLFGKLISKSKDLCDLQPRVKPCLSQSCKHQQHDILVCIDPAVVVVVRSPQGSRTFGGLTRQVSRRMFHGLGGGGHGFQVLRGGHVLQEGHVSKPSDGGDTSHPQCLCTALFLVTDLDEGQDEQGTVIAPTLQVDPAGNLFHSPLSRNHPCSGAFESENFIVSENMDERFIRLLSGSGV